MNGLMISRGVRFSIISLLLCLIAQPVSPSSKVVLFNPHLAGFLQHEH